MPVLSFMFVIVESFPLDEVLESASIVLRVENLSNFPFLVALEDDGLGRRVAASGDVDHGSRLK